MMARRTAPMLRSVALGSQRLTSPILTVGLLVGEPLPRRVRLTEVHLDARGVFDVGPADRLASVAPCESPHEIAVLPPQVPR